MNITNFYYDQSYNIFNFIFGVTIICIIVYCFCNTFIYKRPKVLPNPIIYS